MGWMAANSSRLHSWHGTVVIAWMALGSWKAASPQGYILGMAWLFFNSMDGIGQLVSCNSSLKATFLAWLGYNSMDGIAAIPHLRLHSWHGLVAVAWLALLQILKATFLAWLA